MFTLLSDTLIYYFHTYLSIHSVYHHAINIFKIVYYVSQGRTQKKVLEGVFEN